MKKMKTLGKIIVAGLAIVLLQSSVPDSDPLGGSSYCYMEIPFLPRGYCGDLPGGGKYCFESPQHPLDYKDCTSTLYPL